LLTKNNYTQTDRQTQPSTLSAPAVLASNETLSVDAMYFFVAVQKLQMLNTALIIEPVKLHTML